MLPTRHPYIVVHPGGGGGKEEDGRFEYHNNEDVFMKLDTKSINHPSHLGNLFLYVLGILIFFFLFFSHLCQFFFWLPGPWYLFWIIANPKYIFFDTVDIIDEGILIRHKKKNWLTSRINNVSIPWEQIFQIRAIRIHYARTSFYRYYLVLLDSTMLRIPVPAEKFAANEVAEQFALFLKKKHGQNVAVFTPPMSDLKNCIMVSRIDNIDGMSENIRSSMKRLQIINYKGSFVIGLACLVVLIIEQIKNPTKTPHLALLIITVVFLGASVLPLGHDDTKLNQKYLDFLQETNAETTC